MKFGKLREVNIRELWQHEQYDFSEWLSKEENLELLSETIGLTLTNVNKEVFVGSYRCDLVAEDETTGTKVIIENQLEATNHDHLGKLITYASGLDADVIVWIVKEAREEHRSAIEWLNNNTNKNLSFFLIEVHAYCIGESLPAPKFEIIQKPNDFSKNTRSSITGDNLGKTESERMEFWTQFNQVLINKGKPFNVRKATTNHWYDVALGTSVAHLCICLVNKDNRVWIQLYIDNNKEFFDYMYERKEEIEQKLNFSLDWHRLDGRKSSWAAFYIPGLDFDNHNNYPILMEEIIKNVVKMRDILAPYAKEFNSL